MADSPDATTSPMNSPVSSSSVAPSKADPSISTNGAENDVADAQLAQPPHGSPSYPAFQYSAMLHPVDTSVPGIYPTIATHRASPLSAELRVQTDMWNQGQGNIQGSDSNTPASLIHGHQSASGFNLPVRTSSIISLSASHHTGGSLSPASVRSSPGLGPLSDLTPLPSPLNFGTPPGPWSTLEKLSELSPPSSSHGLPRNMSNGELMPFPRTSPKKRKAYQSLISASPGVSEASQSADITVIGHIRNRSLSEYAPGIQVPRGRYNAVSGSKTPTRAEPKSDIPMQREEYLAVQRGISALPSARPPTPPRSNRSATDGSESGSPPSNPMEMSGQLPARYEAQMIRSGKKTRWTAIRQLGTGTFSTVMLATSEANLERLGNFKAEENLDPKSLVAVKICEHGPAGGADEKKIESSLKRELEILKAIHHPSLVHLLAVSVQNKRAFLVLSYSAGGDLFDLASTKLELLVPSLVRRIFAELVAAVQYLHAQYIVHRDIKLENVLVNLPLTSLPAITDWQTYTDPIVTLTDLGLGRWIPKPPESPLLSTRCGSEDYAAPELLMGQEYDGRATDSWALGVLLYAIIEGRLPFDPIPGSKRKSPTSHRIARCEWSWVRFADEDGEWDANKGQRLEGGRTCVEALLVRARSRWGVEKLMEDDWVKGGVNVQGGLQIEEDVEDS